MDFHRKNYLLSFQVEHQVLEDLTHNTKQKIYLYLFSQDWNILRFVHWKARQEASVN